MMTLQCRRRRTASVWHEINSSCDTAMGTNMVYHDNLSLLPGCRALQAADVIITTPEKWDGISRNWQNRGYVQKVGLLVIDEIHLLGNDRCACRQPYDPICWRVPSFVACHLMARAVHSRVLHVWCTPASALTRSPSRRVRVSKPCYPTRCAACLMHPP